MAVVTLRHEILISSYSLTAAVDFIRDTTVTVQEVESILKSPALYLHKMTVSLSDVQGEGVSVNLYFFSVYMKTVSNHPHPQAHAG